MTNAARGSITTLSETECRARLQTTTVGHLAFVNDEGQQLIPVNFALLDGAIYLRTFPDSVLSVLADGHPDVAFGVGHDDIFRVGWNVTVRGEASGVDDAAIIATVLEHVHPWAGGSRPLVIKVTIDSIAGRRVSVVEP